jgi:hypothetical protein
MSRISVWMAVAVAAGVVGCAQCDTCDDFPVPCTGPNCGQLMPGGLPGYFGESMGPGSNDPQVDQGMPSMGAPTPMTQPANDPAAPAPEAQPTTPAVNPASPPAGM